MAASGWHQGIVSCLGMEANYEAGVCFIHVWPGSPCVDDVKMFLRTL